jgi:hypothetical protein
MDIKESVSAFIATTEQMLDLAKNAEWERLAEMESKRRPELEAFFNGLDQGDLQQNAEQLRQAIEQLLALDNQIIALANASKGEVAELMKKSNATRKAMSEYQSNTAL